MRLCAFTAEGTGSILAGKLKWCMPKGVAKRKKKKGRGSQGSFIPSLG